MPALPPLDSEYILTPDQISEYQRNGHVLLRGLLTPEEVSAYREAILDAVSVLNREARPLEERDTYGKAFLQIMNLWVKDAKVSGLVLSRRLAKWQRN